MRKVSKLLLLAIILVSVFYSRNKILGYWTWTSYWAGGGEQIADDRRRASEAMEAGDLSLSLSLLQEAEQAFAQEGATQDPEEQEQRRISRRNIICDKAVVYEKMAQAALLNGDEEEYYRCLQKARGFLQQCGREAGISAY